MLRVLKHSLILLLFLSGALLANSAPLLKIKGKDSFIIKNYLKRHKEFFTKECKPGTEQKYWNLYKSYRGDGHYIPVLGNDKLDKLTISKFIPELEKKFDWIKSLDKKIKSKKNFKKSIEDLSFLKEKFDKILKYKQIFFEDKIKLNRKNALSSSKYSLISFKLKFREYLEKIEFITSYRFPVDHVQLRESYDEVKSKKTAEERKRSNEIYFYRKIVQDGALNPNGTKSDRFLRANLDNIIREFKKSEDLISESLRYDLESAFTGLKRVLSKGKKHQLKRVNEWIGRSERNLEFYRSLLKNIVPVSKGKISADELVKERISGRYALRKFVLEKEANSFKFWMKEAELDRALFSIETILYNEVGALDGKDALERKDVTQVVINRRFLKEYNQIDATESLYGFLGLRSDKKPLTSYPWLNLLFKEGEFSFTYFFIDGSLRIFCPGQTKYAKRLRRKNLFLAMKLLRNPNSSFNAVRYFSRAAMLGRIDMRHLWDEFIEIPERPGRRVTNKYLLKQVRLKNYRYLYQFIDASGLLHKVLEIKEKTYVYEPVKKRLFNYRNPHYFTYFKKF